jgi:hypothetical protein
MSRANVYRFVPSRDAINESSYGRVINEVDEIAFAIARTNGPAPEKLELTVSSPKWQGAASQSIFPQLPSPRRVWIQDRLNKYGLSGRLHLGFILPAALKERGRNLQAGFQRHCVLDALLLINLSVGQTLGRWRRLKTAEIKVILPIDADVMPQER